MTIPGLFTYFCFFYKEKGIKYKCCFLLTKLGDDCIDDSTVDTKSGFIAEMWNGFFLLLKAVHYGNL